MRSLIVAAFLTAFAAAAVAQPDPRSIKRIAIDPDIPEFGIPLIQSPDHFNAFMIGGGVGVAIDQQTAGKAFLDYMRRNHIDLAGIVRESFRRVLEELKILATGPDADAKLKLKINSYGFGMAGFFAGDQRRPMMNISASLVSGENVVWTKTEYITNLSKFTDAYTYDQLGQNPQMTVQSFEQVSLLVARETLSEWKQ